MITEEEMLYLDSPPNIKEVSLFLYKKFSVNILMKRKFKYYFSDGSNIMVSFREWGIYHMLSIQHIDYTISKKNFFENIENGLSFNDFEKNKALKKRYKNHKERISFFACIYNALRCGKVFYLPSGKIKNTNGIKMDYIIYQTLNNKGMNLGIRYEDGEYIPITILISRAKDQKKYLEDTMFKLVEKLEIIDDSHIIETISYQMIDEPN